MIVFQNDPERMLWIAVYAGIITHPFLRERESPSTDADAAVEAFRLRQQSSTPSGVEGGPQGPVVAVTEPAPGMTGVAPARASIENGGAS